MNNQSKQATGNKNLSDQIAVDEKGNIVIDAQKLMTASSMTTKKPGSNKVARSVNWIR